MFIGQILKGFFFILLDIKSLFLKMNQSCSIKMLGLEGGRHNREAQHILIADSLYHTEETNTTL